MRAGVLRGCVGLRASVGELRPWRPPALNEGTPTLALEFVDGRIGQDVLVEGFHIAPADHPNVAASLEILLYRCMLASSTSGRP